MVIAGADFLLEDQMKIPYGFCHCGCGSKTTISTINCKTHNRTKGEPLKYIHHHFFKKHKYPHFRSDNHKWKNGEYRDSRGYSYIKDPAHAHADCRGYVLKHVKIAASVLGKALPEKTVVHHVEKNNDHKLVICQDNAYHRLLHQRELALKLCGHANWLKCEYCAQYDDPLNMWLRKNRRSGQHRDCRNTYAKNHRNHTARI